MGALNPTILCLAYVLGLLFTALPGALRGIPLGVIACCGLGLVAALVLPRTWRGQRSRVWLVAGGVGVLAVVYFNLRLPQPDDRDISHLIDRDSTTPAVVEVTGQIISTPRLTRSQNIQFWLRAHQAQQIVERQATGDSQTVTGKVYATVPLLQGTGLYPGQAVTVSGSLYQPQPATNPGGFDFRAYLAQEGGFAGLRGTQVIAAAANQAAPVLWRVRQRIVRSQVQALGIPEGALLSAMVMGRSSVDLPSDVQDQFTGSGLAHALAASGFQVSLLVGVLIALTRHLPGQARLGLGISVLVAYIGLTGIQPSVLRAGIMGCAVLLALTADRKVKPLGSLLLAATLLLLYNPLWIWNLGFQFSFLATLGLLVTVPVLVKWFDWLPSTIAPLVAVPIAAYLWTLPLQLQVFGVVSLYTIPINVLTALLITVISIGGMISALAALMYPPAGSALAWLLHYPTQGLMQIAAWGNQLPGSTIAVGAITPVQVVLLYSLFGLIWWQPRWWRYWWWAAALGLSLVAVPVWYTHAHQFRVTVLAASGDAALVIQDKGKATLIASSSEETVNFTILPFLRQQGINRLDWAIVPDAQAAHLAGWSRLLAALPTQTLYAPVELNQPASSLQGAPAAIDHSLLGQLQRQQTQFLPLSLNQPVQAGATQVKLISAAPAVFGFQIQDQQWLLLSHVSAAAQAHLIAAQVLPPAQVLWWSGEDLLPQLVAAVKPTIAIAAARAVSPATIAQLQQSGIELYTTGQDGAMQWTPQQGFTTILGAEAE
jgi:competence protein ComEC